MMALAKVAEPGLLLHGDGWKLRHDTNGVYDGMYEMRLARGIIRLESLSTRLASRILERPEQNCLDNDIHGVL